MMLASEYKRAVQNLLISQQARLKLLTQRVEHGAERYTERRLQDFEQLTHRWEGKIALILERNRGQLALIQGGIKQKTAQILAEYGRRLELATHTMKLVDPKNVLERGYSITRHNGKTVKHLAELKPGDLLETETIEGIIKSIVQS